LQACKQLIDLANGRGGPDNITVQVIRIGGPRPVAAKGVRGRLADTQPPVTRASRMGQVLVGLALFVLGAGLGSGVTYLAMRGERAVASSASGDADAASGQVDVPGVRQDNATPDASDSAVGAADAAAEVADVGPDAGNIDATTKGEGPGASPADAARTPGARRSSRMGDAGGRGDAAVEAPEPSGPGDAAVGSGRVPTDAEDPGSGTARTAPDAAGE
jgi:hypothetical protein